MYIRGTVLVSKQAKQFLSMFGCAPTKRSFTGDGFPGWDGFAVEDRLLSMVVYTSGNAAGAGKLTLVTERGFRPWWA